MADTWPLVPYEFNKFTVPSLINEYSDVEINYVRANVCNSSVCTGTGIRNQLRPTKSSPSNKSFAKF